MRDMAVIGLGRNRNNMDAEAKREREREIKDDTRTLASSHKGVTWFRYIFLP